jgi:two-component system, NtrC family, response regulator GlrR
MEGIKFFIVDFCSARALISRLDEILKDSSCQTFKIQPEFGHVQDETSLAVELAQKISAFAPDLIFLMLSPQRLPLAEVLFHAMREEQGLKVPVLAVADGGQPEDMLAVLRYGAADFITPPLQATDILPRIWRLLEPVPEEANITQRLKTKLGLKKIIGRNPHFLEMLERIPQLAQYDTGILVSGETGTGKELCARAIHYLGPRAPSPFVPVNCGAIPLELVENELFGHERGAFTGADQAKNGLFTEAHRGTIFLDEIDCLPPLAQIKLLRVLQEKEYRPLGATRMKKVDVRVIAATNIELEQAVGEGKFRQDLYYRLSIILIPLMPLRERAEDIPLLARHFLGQFAVKFNKPVKDFSPSAFQKLALHRWPGNVRELEHVVERAVILSRQETIQTDDIILSNLEASRGYESFQESKARMIAQFEKDYLHMILQAHQGNISRAAQSAKKNRRAFWELIRRHRIDVYQFKNMGTPG